MQIVNVFEEGAQGAVYSVNHPIRDDEEVILKVYAPDEISAFKLEVKILKELQDVNGFPILHSAIEGNDSCEIIMQKLGRSLSSAQELAGGKFKEAIVYKICSELVSIFLYFFYI